MAATDGQLGISVSLSGGASLGAYHAGVLGALTTALQAVQGDDRGPRLDAIGGASAGALASMFAVHGLLNGLDTAEVLYQAWVEQVSLDMLRERGAESPLGFRRLRDLLPGELDVDRWSKAPCGPQSTPIGLHVSLTGLRGLRYEVETTDHRVIPGTPHPPHGGHAVGDPGRADRVDRRRRTADVAQVTVTDAGDHAEQILQDDLRRVQHVNHRFERLDQLVEVLAPRLDADAVTALHDVFDDEGLPSSPDADAASALREVVSRVAGLHGKSPVHLDLVSPLLLTARDDRDVPDLLSGEIMGDFGGFADRRLRRSDFALGYECLLAWLPDGLAHVDVDDHLIATAIDAVEQGRRAEWSQVEMGRAGVSDLPSRSRLALLRLGLHTLRVIGNDIWRIARG